MDQDCDNKEKLKVDEQIKFQKKCTEEVKLQESPCSRTHYEHNEKAPNLWGKKTTHEKRKGVSMVRCSRI
jgi:hypothetical protein